MADGSHGTEVLKTYEEYESRITRRHLEIGCLLVMALMPAGVMLDWFVYADRLWFFLALRLACALVAAGVLAWLHAALHLNRRLYPWIGLGIAILPVVSMCGMIYATDGALSPYYAGLNLVLLAVAFVMRWDVGLSVAAVFLTILLYIGACLLHGRVGQEQARIFVNNLYFLSLTGFIVVFGSRVHRLLRVREYQLRFELDRSRQTLQQTNEKLVELDQLKSRFFANVSHELRTPLTLLLAPLERLLHDPTHTLTPATRELLLNMQANAMRLLKLINDLLELVRLDAGALQSKQEPAVLSELLSGLVNAVRPMAEAKRLALELAVTPDLPSVLLDRDRLEKTVLNLLFNALKFTPAEGRVSLRAERKDPDLVLEVADTGVGIAEKDLDRVFDRFWQADDSTRRRSRGLGLGLALVKELTEAQGGSVSVRSAPGQGTTFTLRLPYRPAPEGVSAPAGSPTASIHAAVAPGPGLDTPQDDEWLAGLYRRAELLQGSPPAPGVIEVGPRVRDPQGARALIADDEPEMLRFLVSQLKRHYQVVEAVDGQQAIDRASEWLPDVILLDMMMPEKDGLQVCRELREQATTRDIPILMLTARADEETKLAALSGGASDFLTKPFSTTELHVRVKHLADTYQLQRALAEQNRRLQGALHQLKETEVQLVQTEKIASLGRMSAGIIHEINNPLNFAATGLYALKKHASQLPESQRGTYGEVLRDVEEGLERVKAIVSDLRAFTHPDTEHREWVRVSTVLGEALKFLSHEWRNKVRLEQELPDTVRLWTNRNRLLQVLLNLLQNAFDALRRKAFSGEEPTVWVEGRRERARTLLVIRDNGDGIQAAHLDRIFEPFFTTKDVGQGMGLGLSICYRIVQEHQGTMRVRSERGRFTEFTLEFPDPDSPPSPQEP
jgi:signal transduction histidine kinase